LPSSVAFGENMAKNMSTTEVTYVIINVISEIIKLRQTKKKKQKRIWIKPWIQRRNALGALSTLMRELASEDPDNYCNFLRIKEDMFNILLKKVVLKYII